jgi:hypothetical protein
VLASGIPQVLAAIGLSVAGPLVPACRAGIRQDMTVVTKLRLVTAPVAGAGTADGFATGE